MNAHTNKRDEIYTHRFERMSFTLIQRRKYNKKKEEEAEATSKNGHTCKERRERLLIAHSTLSVGNCDEIVCYKQQL